MQQSSFNESIGPNGLRSVGDIKLLVCYLLRKLDKELTRRQLTEILQENDTANYFEANQAISELIGAGQVLCRFIDNNELLSLSPSATYSVMQIETTLPLSVRESQLRAAVEILARDAVERESKVQIKSGDGGYYVSFLIEDVGVRLLSLEIFVSDISQAELAKRSFYQKAARLYSDIISCLIVE